MVAQSGEQYEREVEICRAFSESKVCGVIVSQAKDTLHYDHFRQLIDHGIPLVFFDRICTGINTSRVVVDDYMGAMTAVNYLIETGCRRIAFFGSSMKLEISKNRYNGYHDALTRHGLTVGFLRRERRYGHRHSLYRQAYGAAGARGCVDLRFHQW